MTAMSTLPIRVDGWTVDDLYLLPDDDRFRYELVDGALLMTPPPVITHGHAVMALGRVLGDALSDEWRVLADAGVRFNDRNYRQPDLMVVLRSALTKRLADPVDVILAVEVMSPSSVSNDRISKPAQYAAAGIPHFWRLEFDEEPVLITHALAGEVYAETGRFSREVVIDQPFALRFNLENLLG